MRAFFVATLMATIIGTLGATAAIAHEGWFVRVCSTKTEANRVHLAYSGGGRASAGPGLRGERTMKRISRAGFTQCQSFISAEYSLNARQHTAAHLRLY